MAIGMLPPRGLKAIAFKRGYRLGGIVAHGKAGSTNFSVSGGGATLAGTVDPEGVVASDEGSTYFNKTDGGFWVKAGGAASNTGWLLILQP